MNGAGVETERGGGSPTRSAQEVLRRMSLNSPPSRVDNPRQVKRAKLLAAEIGAASSRAFAVPQATAQTPATVRKLPPPLSSRATALDGPSPMPSWGVNLRDASAGETLEVGGLSTRLSADRGASFIEREDWLLFSKCSLRCHVIWGRGWASAGMFRLFGGRSSEHGRHGGAAVCRSRQRQTGLPAARTTHGSPRRRVAQVEPHSPWRSQQSWASSRSRNTRTHTHGSPRLLALVPAAGGRGAGVPETPLRRPGTGDRRRLSERSSARGGSADGSCSPVGGYIAGLESSGVQGSPVKRRGAGRWRLSEEGRRETSAQHEREAGCEESPLRRNAPRGPSAPARAHKDRTGDAVMSMPAPAPRSRLPSSSGGLTPSTGGAQGSPMDTGDAGDLDAFSAGTAGVKGDEGSFLRRVSSGSSSSAVPTTGGKKIVQDATNPSPCDVTAFVPVTPCRGRSNAPGQGFSGMTEAGGEGGDDIPMSPVPRAGGGRVVHVSAVCGDKGEKGSARGRFATDFEVKEVIGTGNFGTVYKVRSRVDGCLYAVKCSRRRFKGETDRQNMLMEVYALAALCDSAQETINIVRYHQAWIEDERLYIQTELCETSLEKQLESGHRLEINGVYAFLRQTLLGLDILHQHKLVHLDIKPGNIFVKNGQYKLGDFGLVTPVHVRSGTDVMEGDSRYMSKELLNDDHSNLTKCDVFSLGITLYEIISGRPLPPNGDEWHSLRSGKAGMPMGLPAELSKTLQEMMHPEPARRPSAAELLRYPCLQSEMERQLNDQRSKLNKERTRNSGLLEEVSALIQKQSSQRSGRLSRTITWDNSYFAANGCKGPTSTFNPPAKQALGGTPDHHASRGGGMTSGGEAGARARFNPSPFKPKLSGFFGGGDSAPARFGPGFPSGSSAVAAAGSTRIGTLGVATTGSGGVGQGMLALSSLEEKEEEGAGSPVMAGGGAGGAAVGAGGASRPVSFERLRQA
ncbi:unnamed protein product [Scytosiphon promiscuus]